MKKEEQKAVNAVCELMLEFAEKELCDTYHKCYKLRSMQAKVFETENYFLLQSYETIVAVIRKETDECFDVLRLVYGYTATSAKHISAFDHDYGKGKWGCKARLTWRDI